MFPRRSLVAALLSLMVSSLINAQQVAIESEKSETPEQKRAFALLETVPGKIPTLRSPENRIALSGAVADLLWKKDEKRARNLFEGITKEMVEVVAGMDLSDQQAYNLFSWVYQQRQDIVERMARHDPELALTFLRSTRFPSPGSGSFSTSMERNLEFFLARMIAAKDPERALVLARESLAQGLSYEIGNLLSELHQKNPHAAHRFYESVIQRIKREDLARNHESANIACNLLNSFTPPKADDATFRDLLETVTSAALSINQNDLAGRRLSQNLASSFRANLSLVEKYLPARAPAVRRWLQSVERSLHPSNQIYNEVNDVVQSGTVDDILALATRYPHEMRNHIYQQAAWKAAGAGDEARARQIATDLMSDPLQRRQMLEQLDNQAIWKAMNENRLAEARSLLHKANVGEQRVQVLMRLASLLSGKDDRKSALDCLDEARTVLEASRPSYSKLGLQMQLTMAYALLDPDQGFVIMENVTSQLNALVTAAVVMDGFDNIYLRNGEWMANGASNLGHMIGTMRRNLGHLASINFDRAQTLSDQLERTEIRLMAQFDIAHMVLNKDRSFDPGFGRRLVPIRH